MRDLQVLQFLGYLHIYVFENWRSPRKVQSFGLQGKGDRFLVVPPNQQGYFIYLYFKGF
jgi:hypothetical protein